MEPKSSTDRATAAKEVQIVCLADTSARPDATGPGESFTKSITVIPVLMNRGYHALVSAEDHDRVSALHWGVKIDQDGRTYARAHIPGSGQRGKSYMMHRFILGITDPDVKVDHRDGDGLHNWRENLRASTNSQNVRNQRPHIDKRTSKLKGVYKRPDGRFRAQIMLQYKKFNLGDFTTEEAAARAYDAKARELHGEFARLNFPEAS